MGSLALYGGAFDPPHNGHVTAVQWLLTHGVERVVVVPCSVRADKPELTTGLHRAAMSVAAFQHMDNVIVDTTEAESAIQLFTIDLLSRYAKHQTEPVLFAVGEDLIKNLDKWKDAERFTTFTDFVVMPRPVDNYSSTYVRTAIRQSEPWEHLIPTEVADYIKAHNLYRN